MDRRAASLLIAAMVLDACGGGGDDGEAMPDSSTTDGTTGTGPTQSGTEAMGAAATRKAPETSSSDIAPSVAMWGDSLTLPVVVKLWMLLPSRTIFSGGIAGQTSWEIAARQIADTAHRDWVSIFWYGHNNATEPDRIKADIAESIASLAPGNQRFIVVSVINRATEQGARGGSEYQIVVQLNGELAAAYPLNYLDVRTPLLNRYNPANAQDAQDFRNDVPPSSLRIDDIHLNTAGSDVVARQIQEFIRLKGW